MNQAHLFDHALFLKDWGGNPRFNRLPYERQTAVAARLRRKRWWRATGFQARTTTPGQSHDHAD